MGATQSGMHEKTLCLWLKGYSFLLVFSRAIVEGTKECLHVFVLARGSLTVETETVGVEDEDSQTKWSLLSRTAICCKDQYHLII